MKKIRFPRWSVPSSFPFFYNAFVRNSAGAIAVFSLVLCAFFCGASPALADLYQWVDENGVKHYSNTPPPTMGDMQGQVTTGREDIAAEPAEAPKSSPRVKPAPRPSAIYTKPSRTGDEEVQFRPHADKKVVMYTARNCQRCGEARAFFKHHSVEYTEINISFSRSARDEYQALGGKGVPLILVGGEQVSGLNEGRLRQLLELY